MKAELSRFQSEVVDLMKQGWELGYDQYREAAWLQKGGCGYGGDSRQVHANTLNSLYRRGIIKINTVGYPTTTYKLVEGF